MQGKEILPPFQFESLVGGLLRIDEALAQVGRGLDRHFDRIGEFFAKVTRCDDLVASQEPLPSRIKIVDLGSLQFRVADGVEASQYIGELKWG